MSKAIAEKQSTDLVPSGINWEEDVKDGNDLDNIGTECIAIPFLKLLQAMSPEISEIPEAKAGLFYDPINNTVHEKLWIVHCGFHRSFNHWKERESGGGFLGAHLSDEELVRKALNNRDERGRYIVEPKVSYLMDTRQHFVLVLKNENDTTGIQMVISLSSTGISASKDILTKLKYIQIPGTHKTAPQFAFKWEVTSKRHEKNGNKWFGFDFKKGNVIENHELYNQAKAFNEMIGKQQVKTEMPTTDDHTVIDDDDIDM